MENPTPKYDIGDKVVIPSRNIDGEIFQRYYSEENNAWIYDISMKNRVCSYQEKNLSQ